MTKIFHLNNDDNKSNGEEFIPNEQELEKISETVFDWVDDFYESEYYDKLDEDYQHYVDEVIAYFTSMSYAAFNVGPEEWENDIFATTCIDIMPVTMDREIYFFQSVLPIMEQFMAYLDKTKKLKNAGSMKKHAVVLEKEMDRLLNNPIMWYSYLYVRKKAIEYDVDISDEKELEEFSNREDVFNEEEMKNFIMEKVQRDDEYEYEEEEDEDDEDYDEDEDIDEDEDEDFDEDYDEDEEEDLDEEDLDEEEKKKK